MGTQTNPLIHCAANILDKEMAMSMFALAPDLAAFIGPYSRIVLAFDHTGQYLVLSVIEPMDAGLIAQIDLALDTVQCHPAEPHGPAGDGAVQQVSALFATGREVLSHLCTHSLNGKHGPWLQAASAALPVKGTLTLIVTPLGIQIMICVYASEQTGGQALAPDPSTWGLPTMQRPTLH